MVHKTVIASLLILGMPTALLLIYDALMLRSRPAPLESRDFWVFLGGASVILMLEAWGLRSLLRGQFRRKPVLKTAALVITGFLLLTWQVSVVSDSGHRWRSGVWVFLSCGCFDVGVERSGGPASWTSIIELPTHPPFLSWREVDWSPRIWWSGTGAWEAIRVPLWIVYLQALIATIIIFLRYGSFPSGCCQECSYNLTGNTSGVCPECGIAVPVG